MSVGSGGTLNVSAGGVVSALTINDPNDQNVTAVANVQSGGTVDGSTKIDGGMLILDAGAVFEPHAKLTIANDGWLLLEQNSFKGTIKNFGGSDNLDLAKIRFIGQGPNATTDTFTQTSGAGGLFEVAQGTHHYRPSLDRHLHDRELRTRERWSARQVGDFCPQCLAAGARITDLTDPI